MKTAGGFEQAYNAQAAVDADSQVIVAAGLTNAGNDKQQVVPMAARDRAEHGPRAAGVVGRQRLLLGSESRGVGAARHPRLRRDGPPEAWHGVGDRNGAGAALGCKGCRGVSSKAVTAVAIACASRRWSRSSARSRARGASASSCYGAGEGRRRVAAGLPGPQPAEAGPQVVTRLAGAGRGPSTGHTSVRQPRRPSHQTPTPELAATRPHSISIRLFVLPGQAPSDASSNCRYSSS